MDSLLTFVLGIFLGWVFGVASVRVLAENAKTDRDANERLLDELQYQNKERREIRHKTELNLKSSREALLWGMIAETYGQTGAFAKRTYEAAMTAQAAIHAKNSEEKIEKLYQETLFAWSAYTNDSKLKIVK